MAGPRVARFLAAAAAVAALVGTCGAVQLIELRVPAQVDVRDNVSMLCNYSTDGAPLYSVKWYKDEYEFFRYMPDGNPSRTQAFPVPGITLLMDVCNDTTVTLTNLTFNTTGSYKCEVSKEGPSFDTVYATSNMTVTGNPRADPVLDGIRESYYPGDQVVATCTAAPSHPPANILWYINGKLVEEGVQELEAEVDSRGLVSSRREIKLDAEQRLFSNGKRLRLRCDAVVGDVKRQAQRWAALGGVGSQRLQQGPRSAGNAFAEASSALVIALTVLIMTSSHRH
ncbi:uncharacterized protein LOC126249028 [Schistocerca nitens]|uniref:uncharacterized protein LOC126249028 n=1 Tax=Schistocerca nitens TaxID=7011 RepID=UPI0021188357|nr:uncharacterized protein LOC126249028 [Schistocerca nitens]